MGPLMELPLLLTAEDLLEVGEKFRRILIQMPLAFLRLITNRQDSEDVIGSYGLLPGSYSPDQIYRRRLDLVSMTIAKSEFSRVLAILKRPQTSYPNGEFQRSGSNTIH